MRANDRETEETWVNDEDKEDEKKDNETEVEESE